MTKQSILANWIGSSTDKNPRVLDGQLATARLNEPNGCWARVSPDRQTFLGLYIADTGNDCIRFAHADGRVETIELVGVPDVRSTAGCTDNVCGVPQEEEKKSE